MANTVTVTKNDASRTNFSGLFSEMFKVVATWVDQDAVADDVSVTISLTVPGVKLGDCVVVQPFVPVDLADANASVTLNAWVSAADTVKVKLTNIDEAADAFDADVFTGYTMRFVVGRPTW